MSLASIFGRSSRWSLTVSEDFWPCLAALGGFFVSHWEKYITGVMYLPWLYDVLQVVCRREGGRGGGGGGRERKRKGEGGREQGGISHDCNITYRVVVLAI